MNSKIFLAAAALALAGLASGAQAGDRSTDTILKSTNLGKVSANQSFLGGKKRTRTAAAFSNGGNGTGYTRQLWSTHRPVFESPR